MTASLWQSNVSAPGTWLADLCAQAGMPFVRGHARSMQAMHGGKANHDKIESQTIAALRRGGMLPQASVDPAERRATRDRWRRRTHLMRQRAELLAPGHHPPSPYHLPAMGTQIADQANRDGVAARLADPAVQKRLEVDLARITSYDHLLGDLDRSIVQAATHHDANTLALVQTMPGIGKILSLVRLDDIHDRARFPRGQDFVSSGRLGTWAKESAGKRWGTSGQKIGTGHRTWAFSAAAVLVLRHTPAGQQYLARVEKKHGQGKALTLRAHQLARAVDDRLKRLTAFELDKVLPAYGSRTGAPDASLATQGISLSQACSRPVGLRL